MIVPEAEIYETLAVPGLGSPDRRAAALSAIDVIIDPCSQALGRPVGLVAMGMIARLDEAANRISVTVLPTFPTCMFRGVLQEAIEVRLKALPWCDSVSVRFADAGLVWDESRLSDTARATLRRRPLNDVPHRSRGHVGKSA
jgi:metal-sulfur cluster biosynthetic enzyme